MQSPNFDLPAEFEHRPYHDPNYVDFVRERPLVSLNAITRVERLTHVIDNNQFYGVVSDTTPGGKEVNYWTSDEFITPDEVLDWFDSLQQDYT